MMKKIIATLLLSGSLLAGGTVSSIVPIDLYQPVVDKQFYVGGALNSAETYSREDGEDFTGFGIKEYTNLGVSAIIGWRALKFENTKVFLEGRLGQSFWMEDSENVSTSFASVFLKPTYGENAGVYGLIGGSYVNWDLDKYSYNTGALAIGLGAFAYIEEDVYVFADYTLNATDVYSQYLDSYVNFDVVSVGLLYKF